MKKVFKKMLAMVMATCFIFAFSLTANATGVSLVVDEIIDSFDQPYDYGDMIKGNIITGEITVISQDTIPEYSKTAIYSYEILEIAEKLYTWNKLHVNDTSTLATTSVSPLTLINPNIPFVSTPPTTAPYSGVVLVETYWSSGAPTQGTGFLVSPNVVVTAAHNLTNKASSSIKATGYRVYPFYHSDKEPTALDTYVNAVNYYYPPKYLNSVSGTEEDVMLDWATLTLESDIDGAYYFSYSYFTSNLIGETISMTGYPVCLNNNCGGTGNHLNCEWIYYLATSYGQVVLPNGETNIGNVLYYTNNSLVGNSGSPVYLSSNGNVCYAIHTKSATTYNKATLITEEVFNRIAYDVISGLD